MLNLLHETEEEIQELRMEINKLHTKEEVIWNQQSRVLWLKERDRNTNFFHAMASQRQRKNKSEGIMDSNGDWHDSGKATEDIILN